jgi:predicted kinase
MMLINLPLVTVMGASGLEKWAFARQHFLPIAVLSSDFFHSIVCDDESNH